MKVLSVNERQKKLKQKIPLSPVDVRKAPNVCTLSGQIYEPEKLLITAI